MGTPSFRSYIQSTLAASIDEAVSEYVNSSPDIIEGKARRLTSIREIEYDSSEIKTIWIEDGPNTRFDFDIVVESYFELEGSEGKHTDESEDVKEWFLLSCSANLSKKDCGIGINSIVLYNEKSEQKHPLSDSLLPRLNKYDFDAKAEDILRHYYPEALEKPTKLDLDKFTSAIGLHVEEGFCLSDDLTVFGASIFRERKVTVYNPATMVPIEIEFPAKTILVDPEVELWRNVGSARFTIAHEICHWILHRKRILFECLCGKDFYGIQCHNDGTTKSSQNEDFGIMEWQANMLAPRLLVPKSQLGNKIEELILKYHAEGKSSFLSDNIEQLISDVADFYGLSKQAMKIRLVECGYDEAIEAFIYSDGKHILPVGYKKGSLKQNETFSIDAADLSIQMMINPQLKEAIENEWLVYVDAHVCINSPKYIEVDARGNRYLTDYARHVAHECMLKFTVTTNTKKSAHYDFCVLFRTDDSLVNIALTFDSSVPDTPKDRADALLKTSTDYLGLVQTSFRDTLNNLMEKKKITNEELSELTNIGLSSISKYRNGSQKPSPDMILAILIAMKLPPAVSNEILRNNDITLSRNSERNILLNSFIAFGCYSVDECNEMLVAKGLDKIGGKSTAD